MSKELIQEMVGIIERGFDRGEQLVDLMPEVLMFLADNPTDTMIEAACSAFDISLSEQGCTREATKASFACCLAAAFNPGLLNVLNAGDLPNDLSDPAPDTPPEENG